MPPPAQPAPAPRQRNRSRGWCLTLNNHTEAEKDALIDQSINAGASGYVIQEETGENGTPHLQGFIHFKHQQSLSSLRQWNPRIHWERTRSISQSIAYCSDPAKRTGRIWTTGYTVHDRDLRLVLEPGLYEWQQALLTELRGQPDMRTITWYSDFEGGCGKTAFARFLVYHVQHTVFVSSGTAKDIAYQIVKLPWDPKIVIFNLPRSAEGAMSYAALESVKDGLIFSAKYEGGVKLFAPPHVIIFANFMPDLAKLSMDRWVIRQLWNNPPRVG